MVCTFENCVLKVISCIYSCGPYKLYPTQCKQLPIPLSNTVHASLHRALRSLKPIDLTSLNDFGVIGMGLAVYHGSVLRFCTFWYSFFIYLLVYLCTGTPTARKVSWIQGSVESETGKTVFNLGSCWLHILHDDFRDWCNAAKWNIEDSLYCLRWLLKDAHARREDYTSYRGCTTLPLGFWEMLLLLREHPQYRQISRYMLMLSKLKQNYQSQQKKSFKELECILQWKLITARLNLFLIISREVGP